MSSKSRKAKGTPGSQPTETHPATSAVDSQVQELVDVPKGRNPVTFTLLIILLIFLCVTFMISPYMVMRIFRAGGGNAVLAFEHPTRGTVSLDRTAYLDEKRWLSEWLDFFPTGGWTNADEDVARFQVLDSLAEASGLHVTDSEMTEWVQSIARGAGDVSTYKQVFNSRFSGGVPAFEAYARRWLRMLRYTSLTSYLAASPDPERVLEQWQESHREHAFDYVQLAVADQREAARAELPDDEALRAWFEGLGEVERREFREPDRYRVELVGLLVDGANDAAGLLERYPPLAEAQGPPAPPAPPAPEESEADEATSEAGDADAGEEPGAADAGTPADEDAEEAAPRTDEERLAEIARTYYDRFRFSRFLRPRNEDGSLPPGTEPAFAFEEVEDVVAREAPVYFALEKWLEELSTRAEGGESIDLAAEAAVLGLEVEPVGDALTLEQLRGSAEGFRGPYFANALATIEPGSFTRNVVVDEGALGFGRLIEKRDAYDPEFDEVRDRAIERWVDDRAVEIAEETLAALRDSLVEADDEAADDEAAEDDELAEGALDEARAEADAFRAAVEGAGLTLERRDWLPANALPGQDPDGELPAHEFIRGHAPLYALEEDEIAPPAVGNEGDYAYLVRCAGERAVDASRMSPGEYENAALRVRFDDRSTFAEENFGYASLADRYRIRFPQREDAEPEEPEAPAEEPDGATP